MAEDSDQHGKLLDAALRIYRPSMQRYITGKLNKAQGDDWYEKWLEEQLKGHLRKNALSRYKDKMHRVQTLKLDPLWLIEVGDFSHIIKAYEGDFLPEIQSLTKTMRKIAEGSESRAKGQPVDLILENCNAVLQVVDNDAAEQIQRLIESGEADKPWEAEVGTLPRESKPKEVIDEILYQYRAAMQRYIGATLYSAHKGRTEGYEWFTPLVLEYWPKNDRERIVGEREDGEQPTDFIDVGNIPPIISNNPQDFPKELSDGTYDDLFRRIGKARNKYFAHPSKRRQAARDRTEKMARACVTILTLCARESTNEAVVESIGEAIDEIHRFFDGGGEPGTATQAGTDDGDYAPPARENEDQQALSRRRSAAARFRLLWVAVAAVIAVSTLSYVVYASLSPTDPPPPPPPAVTAPVIDGLTCRPEKPEVGEAITCFASLGGGEPDSWSWSDGGSSPGGSDPTFTTTFSSAGDREISLTVENAADSASQSLPIEVVSALTPAGGTTRISSGAGYSWGITVDGLGDIDSAISGDHVGQASDSPTESRPQPEEPVPEPASNPGKDEPPNSGGSGTPEADAEQDGEAECDRLTDAEGNCLTEQGPPPEPAEQEPPCPITKEDGNCPTGDEDETSDSSGSSMTKADDKQDEMDADDDTTDSESDILEPDDSLDDDDGGLQSDAPGEEEPGTPTVIAEDNLIAFIDDGGPRPDAPGEERPERPIVVAEDNPTIVIRPQEPTDDDLMSDGE